MKTFLIIAGVLAYHGALFSVWRWDRRRLAERSWTVGHKLGRVSGMMGPEWVKGQLDAAGIDPSIMPR